MTSRSAPFRFKRFVIRQDLAAMKVGFDGILLGAWAGVRDCCRILDVGAGTGLIALMLAQRTECISTDGAVVQIDAVEIDEMAVREAEYNVANTPWSSRVKVSHGSIQQFPDTCTYDLVVCNPPYFEHSLPSANHSRSLARHDRELTFEVLCRSVVRILKLTGRLCVILPVERYEQGLATARDHELFCHRILRVKPLPDRPVKRVLLELQLRESLVEEREITVEAQHHIYTNEFRTLTKNFYLSF